jgi:hypothetical protein
MARRVLRLAYWFGVATAATTVATLVIAYSLGAGPSVYGNDDIARYLAGTDPVAGSAPRPASPGTARDGAGHAGGTDGGSGAGQLGQAAAVGNAAAPGGSGGAAAGGGAAPGGGAGGGAAGGGAPTTAPAGGSGPPPPTSPSTSAPGILFSAGGSVVATCSGGNATLVSWTPKTGYQAEDVNPGPAAQASVKFKSDTTPSVLAVVTCPSGTPTLSDQVLSDHGGPGRGGGGSGA